MMPQVKFFPHYSGTQKISRDTANPSLINLITQYGIPAAIYSGRHTIFFSPNINSDINSENVLSVEEQLMGKKRPLTQIGRILNELNIRHIPASSPQAKGRVERFFQTLQQRLVIKLRLAGASTIDEANSVLNEFIKEYNSKFAIPPESPVSAFRPIPSHLRLDHIFCWKEFRILKSW